MPRRQGWRGLLVFVAGLFSAAVARAVPLEPPDEGFAPAPIHSSALQWEITLKTAWPKEKPRPKVVAKSLHIAWDGRSGASPVSPLGHPFPVLYATLGISVPVGAVLSTQSDRPLKGEPYERLLDLFRLNLPVARMDSNSADFFVRFHDGTVAEFELSYRLRLDETVYGMHSSCSRYGIRIVPRSKETFSGFFFARCQVEDGVLNINILKPLDRVFVMRETDRQLIETTNEPVVRVALPENQQIHHAIIGEMSLRDEAGHGERYRLLYEPTSKPPRLSGSFGLMPGMVHYTESFQRLTLYEATLTGKVSAGYKLIPGALDTQISAYGTLLPVTLTPHDRPAARWVGLNYRLGCTLPLGLGATSFGVLVGWYSWYMLVPHNEYGIHDMAGPQVFLAVQHHKAGSLGWSGYLKFASILGDQGIALGQHEVAIGASHDLPIWGFLPRRPAVSVDFAQLDVNVSGVTVSQFSASLGMTYPLF